MIMSYRRLLIDFTMMIDATSPDKCIGGTPCEYEENDHNLIGD